MNVIEDDDEVTNGHGDGIIARIARPMMNDAELRASSEMGKLDLLKKLETRGHFKLEILLNIVMWHHDATLVQEYNDRIKYRNDEIKWMGEDLCEWLYDAHQDRTLFMDRGWYKTLPLFWALLMKVKNEGINTYFPFDWKMLVEMLESLMPLFIPEAMEYIQRKIHDIMNRFYTCQDDLPFMTIKEHAANHQDFDKIYFEPFGKACVFDPYGNLYKLSSVDLLVVKKLGGQVYPWNCNRDGVVASLPRRETRTNEFCGDLLNLGTYETEFGIWDYESYRLIHMRGVVETQQRVMGKWSKKRKRDGRITRVFRKASKREAKIAIEEMKGNYHNCMPGWYKFGY